ncbi:MAG TPA: hypothetical protein VKU00_11575 [Chthonomonadaceae bacterium]|nr:hypothetical protein [Chthonomonadaceae bacterium]
MQAATNGYGHSEERVRVLPDIPDDPLGPDADARNTPVITAALRDYCEAAGRFDKERDEDSREWKLAQAAFLASHEALMDAIDAHVNAAIRCALEEALDPDE